MPDRWERLWTPHRMAYLAGENRPKPDNDVPCPFCSIPSKSDEDALNKSQKQQQTVAKINQDRGGIAYPYANDGKCALFGVYDGHGEGGELVSQYALGEVQRLLEEKLLGLPSTLKNGSKKLESIGEDVTGDNENGHSEKQTSSQEESLIKKAFRETFVKVDRGLLKESDIEVSILTLDT